MEGAIYQMFSHGFDGAFHSVACSTSAVTHDAHQRVWRLANSLPVYAISLIVTFLPLASMLNGFVGEFLIIVALP